MNGRDELSVSAKAALDEEYMIKKSFGLIKIIITILKVVRRWSRRHNILQNLLFWLGFDSINRFLRTLRFGA